jgi:hypothetical protein
MTVRASCSLTNMKNFLKFKTRQNSADLRKFGEEYYMREAKLWRPFRLFGLFATFAAMIFTLSAVVSDHWLEGKGQSRHFRFYVLLLSLLLLLLLLLLLSFSKWHCLF